MARGLSSIYAPRMRPVRTHAESNRQTAFPPVAAPDARVLVLGSMPSQASLAAGEYYAHPRNAFWPIMGALFGFDARAPFSERAQRLMDNRIALWDVAHSCVRPGSLDAAIREVEPNDFAAFFRRHPRIRHIFFNGATAERLFIRLVLPTLDADVRSIPRLRLPSTSPAHAALDFQAKLASWRVVHEALESAAERPHKESQNTPSERNE